MKNIALLFLTGLVSVTVVCTAAAAPIELVPGQDSIFAPPTRHIFDPIVGVNIHTAFCGLKPRPAQATCWKGWDQKEKCQFSPTTGYPLDSAGNEIDHGWGYSITPGSDNRLAWGSEVEALDVYRALCITKNDQLGEVITNSSTVGPNTPLLRVTGFAGIASIIGDAFVTVSVDYNNDVENTVIAIRSSPDGENDWRDEWVGRAVHSGSQKVPNATNRWIRLEVRTAPSFANEKGNPGPAAFGGITINSANLFMQQCFLDQSNLDHCL